MGKFVKLSLSKSVVNVDMVAFVRRDERLPTDQPVVGFVVMDIQKPPIVCISDIHLASLSATQKPGEKTPAMLHAKPGETITAIDQGNYELPLDENDYKTLLAELEKR
jgi:hypothetical protein